MKKYLIIALTAALLLAFFGCGDPPDDGSKKGPNEGLIETPLTLPDPVDASPSDNTGESGSKFFKFIGDDFALIQKANPGSQIAITYDASVDYAVGEIGWIDGTNAGPVIIGNKKTQTVYLDIEDLVIGKDNFTIHIFNQAKLIDVTLFAAPDGYEPPVNPLASAGGKKIVIPPGHTVAGNGDLSKADFKKITKAATSAELVFYFDKLEEGNKTAGILKFGPKSGNPYKHYGISKDGEPIDGDNGWRAAETEESEGGTFKGTITYKISDIVAAIGTAESDYPTGIFNKFEINQGSPAKAELVYIEITGDDEIVSCTCD